MGLSLVSDVARTDLSWQYSRSGILMRAADQLVCCVVSEVRKIISKCHLSAARHFKQVCWVILVTIGASPIYSQAAQQWTLPANWTPSACTRQCNPNYGHKSLKR